LPTINQEIGFARAVAPENENEIVYCFLGSLRQVIRGVEMLNRIVFLVAVLFVIVPIILMSQSLKETNASSPNGGDGKTSDVSVFVRDLHKYSDRWEIELEIQNDSKLPLFFATEPMRSNGENGPYIGLGEADKTLEVGIRFFDRPNYFLSRDETNVKLKKLEPKTSQIEKYVLPLPLRETLPPYKERVTETPRLIDVNKIETLKLSVAVVPDDEGIRDLLAPKASKPFFDGYLDGGEIIEKGLFKGKMLLETQSILSTTYKVIQSKR
jgi:hypothetical protein